MKPNPETLKIRREYAGWSQSELSRRSGVSQGHISDLESDKGNASPSTMKKLASTLGATMGELCRPPDPMSRYVEWSKVPEVLICRECGSLVTDVKAHDGWHRRVEPVADERRF